MLDEFVKITIDNEVHRCQALCFVHWDTILDETKTTLNTRPYFLGYYNHSWPEWLNQLFKNGVLTIESNDEDRPVLSFIDGNISYTVNERDLILRYKTTTGNICYKYMSRDEYDACPKEEYHEVRL